MRQIKVIKASIEGLYVIELIIQGCSWDILWKLIIRMIGMKLTDHLVCSR